jgi:alkylation response protein AidB-like acyl-CoA dehydrogenase
MDFTHSADRQMLGDTLRRFLADKGAVESRSHAAYGETGFSMERWRELGELGIASALFDEASGGFGGSGFDIMVVFEELGRALAVEPFLGTLMAGRALAGREELSGIISGATIAAVALDDGAAETRAVGTGDGWTIDGAKAVVPFADAADLLLVTATGDDGPALFVMPARTPGVSIRGYGNIEGGRSGDVTLTGVALPAQARVGGQEAIDAAEQAGLLALAAEALGVMEVLKEATLEYLRTRVQFGVPIGKFQALQHRMATVLLEIEQARSSVINAAAAFDGSDKIARERALAAAKYTAGRTGSLVAEEAIQLHGGIGMTWEMPLSHYAKRLIMIDHQLGDEDFHLQRYIALGRTL